MTGENDFRIRPGRIRSSGAQGNRPFIAQALAAAQKAGAGISRSGRIVHGNRSRFGKGQRASIQANRLITSRSRGAVVKARVVRQNVRSAPLSTHLNYLRREGVTRDGEKARLFGRESDEVDGLAFAERCEEDRHHFRFIVSPEDAVEMTDLRSFASDLVSQMEKDLDTRLDWVGVDHWNTAHPHIHLIVRGVRDDGENLVISRDYIKEGMRDRARDLITQDLGPRTDLDIRRNLERQVEAERWTQLDRQLVRDGRETGIIDMAPDPQARPDEYHALKAGRLRKLESLGLADQVGHGQWMIAGNAEATLRSLSERGDIIKRMHRALTERGIERGSANYVLAAESLDTPIIGRLVTRGLDDALKGTAYAVVDGVDGRTHHIKLSDLDAASDGVMGSIVELRKFDDAKGERRVMLAVRSDLDIDRQITAPGATWLDRQNIAREPVALSEGGFGAEVRHAMDRRADHLVEQGFAERHGQRITFSRNLIEKLRGRELEALGEKLAAETGQPFNRAGSGEYIAGSYRQRFTLASGRFAMIDAMTEHSVKAQQTFDGNDYQATHIIAYAGDEPIGTLRIRWFRDFAKFERTAFRQPYRNIRILKIVADFSFDHVARKGYDRVITHAQPKYARLWRMAFGFKNVEGKKPVYFDGHEEPYTELVKELTPPPNAISDRTDATVLFRTEGYWDAPSKYEIAAPQA